MFIDGFNDIEIFKKDYFYKIKLLFIESYENDRMITFYFASHCKFYKLAFCENYPDTPFLEFEMISEEPVMDSSRSDLSYMDENKEIFVTSISNQEIETNLFSLSIKAISAIDRVKEKTKYFSMFDIL